MKNYNSIQIPIRSIQHYMYCRHRWGLIEIGKMWSENAFVTKANIVHERVHNPQSNYSTDDKKVYTSLRVYNDKEEYGLYGVTDCLEVIVSEDGNFDYCIVEYKPTKPKDRDFRKDDLMQVFAQKICVDNVFDCDCRGVIYYADVKKRYKLPLREQFQQYDDNLKSMLREMRTLLETGEIPSETRNQKCNGCSMADICMPKLNIKRTVRETIADIEEALQL